MWPRLSINPKIRERVTTRKLSHPHHENQSANYYLILHNLLAIDGYDIQPQASFTRSSHITYQSTLADIYQHLVKDSSQNQIFTIINQFTFVKIINHYLLPSMQSKQSQIHNQKSSQTDFFTKSITSLSQDNNPKLKMNQSSNDPIGMNHIHSQHKRSE